MEIKILHSRLDENEDFEKKVNALLAEGWVLDRLDVLRTHGPWLCYAQLHADGVEELEYDPVTWEDAVDVLRGTCGTAESCSEGGCPMFAWCQKNLPETKPPANWDEAETLDLSE